MKEINDMTIEELNKFIREANKRLTKLRKPEFDKLNKQREEKLQYHLNNCNPRDICCINCESLPENCDCLDCEGICSDCQIVLSGSCREEKKRLEEYQNKSKEEKNK